LSESKFRDEIQSDRAFWRDLLKWKMILSGGAFALGLGFTGSQAPYAHLALCSVPLVVTYCDLLIRDAELRIAIKAWFLLERTDDIFADYERFIETPAIAGVRWYAFSHFAIHYLSLFMCLLVVAIGICLPSVAETDLSLSSIPLILTGSLGAIAVTTVHKVARSKRRKMRAELRKQQNRLPQ